MHRAEPTGLETKGAVVDGGGGFARWLDQVEALVRARLRVDLKALGDLPLIDGFEAGETAAEFYAGCIAELAADFGLARD